MGVYITVHAFFSPLPPLYFDLIQFMCLLRVANVVLHSFLASHNYALHKASELYVGGVSLPFLPPSLTLAMCTCPPVNTSLAKYFILKSWFVRYERTYTIEKGGYF